MTRDYRTMADVLVDGYLGSRLERAGDPPGLREAAVDLATTALVSPGLEQLMRHQLDQLRGPSSEAVPDAYLADEAATEDALQRAAAGLRVAAAQTGRILEPRSFERGAALRLADDPRLALRAELARVPRPVTRPEALRWSLEPTPWANANDRDEVGLWPPPGLDAAAALRCLPGGASALARVEGGPHVDWIQIGMMERHFTPARRYPDRPSRLVLIGVGLEITDTEPPARSLPFASSPWHLWIAPWRRLAPTADTDAAIRQLSTLNSPLVALADDGRGGALLRRAGLGGPPFLLAPVLPLVMALGLEPTPGISGFSLGDADGPGLVGRQWRGHLVHDGNYQPLTPAVEGADLLVRPDLLARLLDIVGAVRTRTGVSVSRRDGDEDGEDE
jgi:hypothetical protein